MKLRLLMAFFLFLSQVQYSLTMHDLVVVAEKIKCAFNVFDTSFISRIRWCFEHKITHVVHIRLLILGSGTIKAHHTAAARCCEKNAMHATLCYSLSTLSQKSATVAEFGDCRRCLAVFCDSRTFLRQCGQGFMLYVDWNCSTLNYTTLNDVLVLRCLVVNKTAELSQRRPRDAPNIWLPSKVLRALTTHPATFPEICNGLCSDRY